jgi:hypothetical protein
VNNASCIFGGFASVAWDKTNKYKTDQNSFIFSLRNKINLSLKLIPLPNKVIYAVSCFEFNGPSFGLDDIYFGGNVDRNCFSQVGFTFSHKNLRNLIRNKFYPCLVKTKISF